MLRSSLYFIAVVGLFYACAENTETASEVNTEVIDVYAGPADAEELMLNLKDSSFVCKINPLLDTVITCPKGTKIYFAANIFENNSNDLKDSSITVTIQECYSNSDFYANNLTCTASGALLETGGMVKIEAESDGKPLSVKEGGNYAVFFPKNSDREDMQTFYGVTDSAGVTAWDLGNVADMQPSLITTTPVSSSGAALLPSEQGCKISVSSYKAGHDAKINDGSADISWKFENLDQTMQEFFELNFKPSKAMEEAFCLNDYTIKADMDLTEKGQVKVVRILESATPEYDQFLIDFIKTFPPFEMSTMGTSRFKNTYYFSIAGFATYSSTKNYDNFKKKYVSFKDKAMEKVENAELNYFVMSASKLGWINCDRFWNTDSEKTNIYVDASKDGFLTTVLVFNDINSIMHGVESDGKKKFSNIPVGESVRLIGILIEEGRPSMAIKAFTIDGNPITLSDFKPFTVEELESELNKTN